MLVLVGLFSIISAETVRPVLPCMNSVPLPGPGAHFCSATALLAGKAGEESSPHSHHGKKFCVHWRQSLKT